MGIKPYPTYKPSGLDWLGEIPNHWDVLKLKYIGNALIGLTYSPNDIVNEGEGTLVLRASNIQNARLVFQDNVYVDTYIPSKLRTKINDILICSRSGSRNLIGKNVLIDKNSAGLSFGAFMTVFRSEFNQYLFQVFNSTLFEYQSSSFLTSTINQITLGNLNNLLIPFPPLTEQQEIADFLDRETVVIDTLIAKKQELIQRLHEKRTALISHTVTKGLNPTAPMKDSGIEWLGQIPIHWDILKLKYVGVALIGLTYSPNDIVDEGDGTLVLRASNIQNARIVFQDNVYVDTLISSKLRTQIDDILICSRSGSRSLIGKNALIDEKLVGLSFGAFMTIFRSEFNQYLFQVFNSTLFEFQSSSFLTSTINQITLGNLNNLLVPFPPLAEQIEIVEHLNHRLSLLDDLVNNIEKAIGRLTEYRTALISAVVTGKIDVRVHRLGVS